VRTRSQRLRARALRERTFIPKIDEKPCVFHRERSDIKKAVFGVQVKMNEAHFASFLVI
jgi:hypothetical protein